MFERIEVFTTDTGTSIEVDVTCRPTEVCRALRDAANVLVMEANPSLRDAANIFRGAKRERTPPETSLGRGSQSFNMAEGGGFRPPRACAQRAFQARAIGH